MNDSIMQAKSRREILICRDTARQRGGTVSVCRAPRPDKARRQWWLESGCTLLVSKTLVAFLPTMLDGALWRRDTRRMRTGRVGRKQLEAKRDASRGLISIPSTGRWLSEPASHDCVCTAGR